VRKKEGWKEGKEVERAASPFLDAERKNGRKGKDGRGRTQIDRMNGFQRIELRSESVPPVEIKQIRSFCKSVLSITFHVL